MLGNHEEPRCVGVQCNESMIIIGLNILVLSKIKSKAVRSYSLRLEGRIMHSLYTHTYMLVNSQGKRK